VTVLVSWIAFPLALGALLLGCGLVLDRAAGHRVSGVLLLPAGLSAVEVVSAFTTKWGPTT